MREVAIEKSGKDKQQRKGPSSQRLNAFSCLCIAATKPCLLIPLNVNQGVKKTKMCALSLLL